MTKDSFYDHYIQDQPTKAGAKFASALNEHLFRFAGMQAGHSVLEIGPGRGALADICLSRGLRYTAIEPNGQMAESLRGRGAEVIQAKVPPLPPMERKFDYVVMNNVLEHMNGMPEALLISQQIRERLVPGGRFVVCSPDYLNMRRHFFNCDFSHGYVTTQRRLSQLLISAGYGEMKSGYVAGPFQGVAAVVVSVVAVHLPFGTLLSWWPKSRLLGKLYKLQLTLCRKVLIVSENFASASGQPST